MFEVGENTVIEIQKFYNKTPKEIEEIIGIIKVWLRSQHHLPEMMEDVKIRNFLLFNKFSIEKTKQKIDMYYTMRHIVPEMFKNPLDKEQLDIQKILHCAPYPKLYKNLYRIIMVNFKQPNTASFEKVATIINNTFEVRLYEDYCLGELIITDCKNLTLNDVTHASATVFLKLFKVAKEIYSMRMYKCILINCPAYATSILSIIKTVLPEKIFSRFECHKDAAILKEIFSQDDLPKDYGGNGPSLDELNEGIKNTFLKYKKRFDYMDTMRPDESLRAEKPKNDEILGFYGNFRQLGID